MSTSQAPLSRHARLRMAQRALPPAAIDLMLDYGSSVRIRGTDSYFFDKAARRRLLEADPALQRRAERYLNAFAIVGDNGVIVTAAWRTRRLRRS